MNITTVYHVVSIIALVVATILALMQIAEKLDERRAFLRSKKRKK